MTVQDNVQGGSVYPVSLDGALTVHKDFPHPTTQTGGGHYCLRSGKKEGTPSVHQLPLIFKGQEKGKCISPSALWICNAF